jgi:delta(3,5)-delta(2,4)-dienoyl-CoA isomerase
MSQDYSSFTLLTVTFPSPPIAHVQLNRPAKLNAFSHALWLEFGRVFRLLDRDSDVRAVVLSGAGDRAFCAGLDVKDAAGDEVMTGGQEDGARWAWKVRRERIEVYQESVSAVEECSKRELFIPLPVWSGDLCYRHLQPEGLSYTDYHTNRL